MTCWQTYLYPIQHHGQQHTSHSYVVLYIWLLTLSSILGNTKYRVREGLRIGGILRHFPSSIMRPSSHSVLFDQKNRCFCLPRPPSCSSPPLRIASIVPLFLWFQLLVNLVVALSDNWLHFTRSRQYGSPSQPPPFTTDDRAIIAELRRMHHAGATHAELEAKATAMLVNTGHQSTPSTSTLITTTPPKKPPKKLN